MVTNEEKDTSQDLIRQLFEGNHELVQKGFWMSFREASEIPSMMANATFHLISSHLGLATVEVRTGLDSLNFNVYQEGGEWKLGLIESMENQRGFAQN